MSQVRQPGMDHSYYDYSPLVDRPPLAWPNGQKVALCVIVALEHFDWLPPSGAYSLAPSGVPFSSPFPNIRTYSHYQYGVRVGIFRVMEVLDRYGIRGTLAIDATVAEQFPLVVEEAQRRGWEFIAHGRAVTQMVTSRMTEEEERRYIETSVDALRGATGERPVGWLGPEYGESVRTPELLARAGLRYTCDWPNDEQPYLMKVSAGMLMSLPILLDLDDVISHYVRHVPIMRYGRLLKEAFDGLYADGSRTGRLMAMNIHPWLI